MTYTWTNWDKPKDDIDPYIHWATVGPGEDQIKREDESDLRDGDNVLKFIPQRFLPDDTWYHFKHLDQIVVPTLALNPDGDVGVKQPEQANLPSGEDGTLSTVIDPKTIIAGVIDVGMPLGHRRLRFADGKTRILSAWQMIGNWSLNPARFPDVPFGCAFYEHEINEHLQDFSGGTFKGRLDEEAFHKRLGALNLSQVSRQTSLAQRASHGAHVLDMVAGADPGATDNFDERVRIIAVNAPSSAVFGASGTYLDSYMLHAIQHVADVADGIWKKMKDAGADVPEGGFPIVINLSFGKHAGYKDIHDRFAAALDQFQDIRVKKQRKARIGIVMPTGNDNLARCNAFLEPMRGQPKALNWRVLPQDQSSNFTEVWFEQVDRQKDELTPAIRLSFNAPGATVPTPQPPKLTKGETQFCALQRDGVTVAHLYVAWAVPEDHVREGKIRRTERNRFRYILCVAPTYRLDGDPSVADSGVWRISLQTRRREGHFVTLSIQTDQGLTPNRVINLRSYFDDPGYVTNDSDGRPLESYSYPRNADGVYINNDILAVTPVRRHGTMNASAAHKGAARVGGYRASDGRPSFYSSTGRGRRDGKDAGTTLPRPQGTKTKRAPTAAFPTDDGPAHGGILSAGSTDGSQVVMRGTSFAASQASRRLICAINDGTAQTTASETLWLIARSSELNRHVPEILGYDTELIEVIGAGRIPSPRTAGQRRVRLGPFDT
ncbi:hypothetical protein KQ247_12400 [Ruegeria pomeroyi]|nr:hypothetical protein [Ruegeria pomeroyi]NVK98826.1 hypothetical protein [Ruegeria pomeroyi]NVL00634.1 hypothetical protein [Ruegeria pomeroyi]QWV07634.1 hypothetical protein KQ247_12400 [Ruegeria pomeroyi]